MKVEVLGWIQEGWGAGRGVGDPEPPRFPQPFLFTKGKFTNPVEYTVVSWKRWKIYLECTFREGNWIKSFTAVSSLTVLSLCDRQDEAAVSLSWAPGSDGPRRRFSFSSEWGSVEYSKSVSHLSQVETIVVQTFLAQIMIWIDSLNSLLNKAGEMLFLAEIRPRWENGKHFNIETFTERHTHH